MTYRERVCSRFVGIRLFGLFLQVPRTAPEVLDQADDFWVQCLLLHFSSCLLQSTAELIVAYCKK